MKRPTPQGNCEIEHVFWLVDSYQYMVPNRSQVRYEYTNAKNLGKKLTTIKESSICRRKYVSVFATVFVPFTHTNTYCQL